VRPIEDSLPHIRGYETCTMSSVEMDLPDRLNENEWTTHHHAIDTNKVDVIDGRRHTLR